MNVCSPFRRIILLVFSMYAFWDYADGAITSISDLSTCLDDTDQLDLKITDLYDSNLMEQQHFIELDTKRPSRFPSKGLRMYIAANLHRCGTLTCCVYGVVLSYSLSHSSQDTTAR